MADCETQVYRLLPTVRSAGFAQFELITHLVDLRSLLLDTGGEDLDFLLLLRRSRS